MNGLEKDGQEIILFDVNELEFIPRNFKANVRTPRVLCQWTESIYLRQWIDFGKLYNNPV